MEMSGWSVNVTTLIRGKGLDLLSSFKTSTKVHILSPVAEGETKVAGQGIEPFTCTVFQNFALC